MKNKKTFKIMWRMILITIVSVLFNFSIICLAATTLLIILYFFKGNWNFVENASPINIVTLATGVIIFIPTYLLRKNLKRTDY